MFLGAEHNAEQSESMMKTFKTNFFVIYAVKKYCIIWIEIGTLVKSKFPLLVLSVSNTKHNAELTETNS